MLFLVFQLGSGRYALAAREVVEILPVVEFRPLPQALSGVAGLFNYRGAPAPLVDLSLLATGQPCRRRMSTRIVLVRYPEGAASRPLGLLVEQATETLRREESDFASTGITVEATPFLGPVTRDERGLIQRVEVKFLLTEDVRAILFRGSPEPVPCP